MKLWPIQQRLKGEVGLQAMHYGMVDTAMRQLEKEGVTVKEAVNRRKAWYERQIAAQRAGK